MALLNILVMPHAFLRHTAKPVGEVTQEVRQLMDDMLETMYHAPGIGLAATQVGVDKRVIVVDVANAENDEKPNPLKLANPEVTQTSPELTTAQEGCLSLPCVFEDVTRPAACTVKGLDENGKEVIIDADGLLATCLQHEIDHLDGILFIDHLSRLKKNMILKKMKKDQKQAQSKAHDPTM